MSDLIAFAGRLHDQLTSASREPHWKPDEAKRYMAGIATRREAFASIAARLSEFVIQPRLETLAGYFPNASTSTNEPPGHCSCWFGFCERFPASTKVTFAIEHDVRCETVLICYEGAMMPLFIKMHEHDRITLPVENGHDEEVAEWVEERLVDFVTTYLQIDRGSEEFEEDAATDPVCGMRVSRSSAVASDTYRGHPYFFCSTECQQEFARKPTVFVEVKTM